MKSYTIKFANGDNQDLTLLEGSELSEHLTALNSPMLFGCRAGVCGTCLCEVSVLAGELLGPSKDEQEALDLYAPTNSAARLACQLQLTADITIKKIDAYE